MLTEVQLLSRRLAHGGTEITAFGEEVDATVADGQIPLPPPPPPPALLLPPLRLIFSMLRLISPR